MTGSHLIPLATAIAIVALPSSGCIYQNAKESLSSQEDGDQRPLSTVEVCVGQSIGKFHVGMTAQRARQLAIPDTTSRVVDREWFRYERDGIELALIDDRVHTILFKLDTKKEESRLLKTKEGIDADSTIKDVICRFGQPKLLANRLEGDGPAEHRVVSLLYDSGIFFDFIDERLDKVAVFPPVKDSEGVRRDIGDTKEYRQIECD